MSLGATRYPSNAAALPTHQVMAADALMNKSAQRAAAWPMAWALIEAKAKAGDHEAADLIAFVDAGGAA